MRRNALVRDRDELAPDGVFSAGWRLVRTGGRVKAAGYWYAHKALEEFVGKNVWVVMDEYWMTSVTCYIIPWDMTICTAKGCEKDGSRPET